MALVTGMLASFHLDNCFNTLLTGLGKLDQSHLGLETALLPLKWIATFASVKNLVMGESFEHFANFLPGVASSVPTVDLL